ncbi:MAG: hypothetical protein DRJ31_00450 [Candidatus Methanomethylicota archaeon]|uniref:Major facilitator superfamily (MFS) profile domain-containing protein n=1 Tax=Thermoproteota archaeon TaxID=2056631 RepID=A0A497ETF3_9CREN|nr:MAG: hypothetical protein DRJ31_00450 [Candidatus Verstraetearchaeota archaeon]
MLFQGDVLYRLLREVKDPRFVLALFLINSLSWSLAICIALPSMVYFKVKPLIHTSSIILFVFIALSMLFCLLKPSSLINPVLYLGWPILGVFSLMILRLHNFTPFSIIPSFLLLGISIGLYLPLLGGSFLGYTTFDDRGRLSAGVLAASIAALLFLLVIGYGRAFLYLDSLSAWRLIGFFLAIFSYRALSLKHGEYEVRIKRFVIALLLAMWGFFLAISSIFVVLTFNVFSLLASHHLAIYSLVVAAAFAAASGVFIDYYGGRKGLLAVTYVCLGISVSLLPFMNITTFLSIYLVIEGAAFGILSLMFVFIIPGDSYYISTRLAMFSLSVLILLAGFTFMPLAVLFGVRLALNLHIVLLFVSLSYLLCFLILFFVPELLPSEVSERRKIREYVRLAKRIKKKYESTRL